MAENIKRINLIDLVPDSLRGDPQIQAAAAAVDAELKAVTEAISSTLLIPRIKDLPETVIDLLAWQWHVDFYEPVWIDIETKKVLVRQSIPWHRRKGTPDIVEEAVQTIFGSGTVKEWFEYGGKPYFFGVESSVNIPDNETYERLVRVIHAVKNTRSWLEFIRIIREKQMTLYHAQILHTKKKTTIYPSFTMPKPIEKLYLAHAQTSIRRTTIQPTFTLPKLMGKLYIANAQSIIRRTTIYPKEMMA